MSEEQPKPAEPSFTPEERKKRRFFAQYDERAYDEFGRPIRHVVVTDINIPFWSLVGLLVQLALAAIPAAIILALLFEAVKWAWTLLSAAIAVRQ